MGTLQEKKKEAEMTFLEGCFFLELNLQQQLKET